MKLFRKLVCFAVAGLALTTANAQTAETRMTNVRDQGFVANYYAPSAGSPKYGILLLGGSEGGLPDNFVRVLANTGYPILALAYFNAPTLPDNLELIPIEYFDKPIQWLMKQENVDPSGLIIVGASKGAELALLLASRRPEVRGVVAVAPSSVRWAGILQQWNRAALSSWSENGKPMTYVPYDSSNGVQSLVALYTQSMKNKAAMEQAAIEVERISAKTLLMSGSQDKVWPAKDMADAVCQRMNARRETPLCVHMNYPELGHLLSLVSSAAATDKPHPPREEILSFLKTVNVAPKSAPATAMVTSAPAEPDNRLVKIDNVVGAGDTAMLGKTVVVHYTGWFYKPLAANQRGRKFDSSLDAGKPFEFLLGAGKVIKGWDQGVAGMKVGGKRTLIIPSQLAYGSRGAGGGVIPPDSDLIFDVELLQVK